MKKFISIALAALLLLSCFAVCATAAEEDDVFVSLRIEGVDENLLDTDIFYDFGDKETATVADVLKEAVDVEENLSIEGIDDGYVKSINGLSSGKFGGWDGWYFAVNDTPSESGISTATVKPQDKIVFYYGGFPCQYPVADFSKAESDGIITFQSYDATYDENYVPSYAWTPVTDATVYLDNENEYTTDKNGQIKFERDDYESFVSVQIKKLDKSGAPAVCRFAEDFGFELPEIPVETETGESTEPQETTSPATAPTEQPTTTEPDVTEPDETGTQAVTTEPVAPTTAPEATTVPATEPEATTVPATEPAPTATEITTTPETKPAPVYNTKVKISVEKKTIYIKGTTVAFAVVEYPVGKTAFKSSNTKIAVVNKLTGIVRAKKAGTVRISATNNGVTKSVKITVKKPSLNKSSVTLKKAKTFKLKVKGLVGSAKYTVTKKNIAKVSKKGVIKALKKGKTVVKVKANGITLKCTVKVK